MESTKIILIALSLFFLITSFFLKIKYNKLFTKFKYNSELKYEYEKQVNILEVKCKDLDGKCKKLDADCKKLKAIKPPRKKREHIPKVLPPNELIDGRIYVVNDNVNMIIRFKLKCAKYEQHYYSCIGADGTYFKNNFFDIKYEGKMYREANDEESKRLIMSEINHGFFYELKTKK